MLVLNVKLIRVQFEKNNIKGNIPQNTSCTLLIGLKNENQQQVIKSNFTTS